MWGIQRGIVYENVSENTMKYQLVMSSQYFLRLAQVTTKDVAILSAHFIQARGMCSPVHPVTDTNTRALTRRFSMNLSYTRAQSLGQAFQKHSFSKPTLKGEAADVAKRVTVFPLKNGSQWHLVSAIRIGLCL